MPSLSEFRGQYPQYSDLSDEDLMSRARANGIDVTPDRAGAIPNAIMGGQQALRGVGRGVYDVAREYAARFGWDATRQWLDQELTNRDAEMQERQGRMREGRLSHFSDDPIGVLSGAIGQAGGSIPLALNPLGWGMMAAGMAGDNIQEQREARGVGVGEADMTTAIAAAAAQTAAERMLGLEGWVARGAGRGTGGIAARGARGFVAGAAGEGFTEGLQEAIQIAQGDLTDPGRVLGGDMLARVGEAAGLGAIGGGAIRGGISLTGQERQAEATPLQQGMNIEEALSILQRGAVPEAAPQRPLPGVTSRPVDMGTVPPASPAIEAALNHADPVMRDIAQQAIPTEEKERYLRARQLRLNEAAIRNDAGAAAVAAQAGQTPAATAQPAEVQEPAQQPAALPAPTQAPPAEGQTRDRAVSPLDDVVAGMRPEGHVDTTIPVPQNTRAVEAPGDVSPPGVSSLNSPAPETQSREPGLLQQAEQTTRPTREQLVQAQALIDENLNRFRSRGRQGEEIARATRAAIDDGLFKGDLDARQVAAAFTMAEAMSRAMPANAGQQISFAGKLAGMSPEGNAYQKQGEQTRYRQATPEGLQGMIRLSLANEMLPMARETAAHEAFHVIEDWFRQTDPKVARELDRAFPAQPDGTVRLKDVDASLLRLLKRHKHGQETYFDYLSKDETGHGPGVFKNPGEAMATVFGAVYDIQATGAPVVMKPLLKRAFDAFVRAIDAIRKSPARTIMEDVAAGRTRERVGQQTANITQNAMNSVQREPSSVRGEPNRQSARTTNVANAKPSDAIRALRRSLATGSGTDGRAWADAGTGGEVGGSRLSLTPEARRAFEAAGIVAPDMVELPSGQDSALRFESAISNAKDASPFGASVYVYPAEDYAGMRLFLSPDGKAGFALKPSSDGIIDIVSVFSTPGAGYRGAAYPMVRLAVEEGGNKLDAFDTVLPSIYAANGFTTKARMRWNEEYAPDGWDKTTFAPFNGGEPDVVFMAYNRDNFSPYAKEGPYVEDYDEAVRLQEEGLVRDSARRVFEMPTDDELEAQGATIRGDTATYGQKYGGFGPFRIKEMMSRTDQATRTRWALADRRFRDVYMNQETFNTRDGLTALQDLLPGGYRPMFEALRKSIPVRAMTYTNNFPGRNATSSGGLYRIDRALGSHFHRTGSGMDGYIYMDGKGKQANMAMVFVHEAVHAATVAQLDIMETKARNGNAEAMHRLGLLDQLRDLAAAHAMDNDVWLDRMNAGTFGYMTRGANYLTNSTTDIDKKSGRQEFMAEALASPYFQSFLSTVPLTPELAQEFEEVLGGRPRNVLQAMVDWIRSTLGLKPDSILDGTFILAPDFFNMGHTIPTDTVQGEPNTVSANRESARKIPPEVQKVLDKVAPGHASGLAGAKTAITGTSSEPVAGWMSRMLARKPWMAGMRANMASNFRTWAVDQYTAVEDQERRLNGGSRLYADLSGYTALWQAEDVDRYLTTMLETGGYLELVQPDPSDPGRSWFKVNPSNDGGIGWLTRFATGHDPVTGKQLKKPDGSPLIETAEEADALMRSFQAYSIAKRGTNLTAQGIVTGIGQAERDAAKAAVQAFPEIPAAYDQYQKFNQNLMKMAVASGVISQADANAFMKYNDYYPFYRAIPKTDPLGARRIAGISSKFKPKEIIGGDTPFVDDPITVILDNAAYWMHASMRNVAKQKVIRGGTKLGTIKPFDPKTDSNDTKLNVRVNGSDYAFTTTDPSLMGALESYWGLPPEMHNTFSIIGWPARMLRELVTKNPSFMLLTNPIRDSVSAWQASGSDITPVLGTYKGMVQAYMRDPKVMDYLLLGHAGSRRYEDSAFRDAGELLRNDLLVERGVYRASTPGMLGNVIRKAYLKWDHVSEASDLGTRMAIYQQELANTNGNEVEAAWRAREVMNFTKRGQSMALRMMSMLVPFTNARIQGLDVLYQSLHGGRVGDPKKAMNQNIGKALARGAILTTIAVMMQIMFGDDDEIKEAPEYLRNQNTLIPLRALGLADSGLLAIPKPFEYGAIFMTLPEHLYRWYNGQQTLRGVMRDGVGAIPASMSYNPIPTAILPFVEQAANYSFFTNRPIVGRALQTQSPEWQFTAATPALYRDFAMSFTATGIPAFMKSIGLELPAFMSSPVSMDHFVRSFTGALGTQAVLATGALIGSEEYRTYDWQRMPMASTLIRTRGNTAPGATNTLYDLAEESNELGQQIRRYTEAGNMAMVRDLQANNSALIQARPMIQTAQRSMTRLSQQERALIRDPRIPADDRRRRLQAIEAQRRETLRTIEDLRLRVGR